MNVYIQIGYSYLRNHVFLVILMGIISFVCVQTYEPSTYLTGWDTLHPEFDIALNWERLWNGVWREEQGLGTVAGHTHMVELPRLALLWVLHVFLPVSFLRYAFVFLCLFVGPMGMYFLLRRVLSPQSNSLSQIVGFLAGLIYLFHLSTVQQFFVPFEMFPVQYALLPWIMLYTVRYLYKGGKKELFFFSLATLCATPQAYAAHLWYPFFGIYGMFLGLYVLLHRFNLDLVRKSALLILLTLVMNSYWLLPNMYYIVSSSDVPKESKQNRIFSQEYRLRNRSTGYLEDVALGIGFYYNWQIYDMDRNQNVLLMEQWREHLSRPMVAFFGYGMFVLVLGGIGLAIYRRDRLLIAFLPFFVVPFVFLMNNTPLFEQFFDFLLEFSLTEEALRFVFTKFSIVYGFTFPVYGAYFLCFLFRRMHKRMVYGSTILIVAGLIGYAWPMLQGGLISDKMKVSIPSEYFAFWDYMKEQDEGVVFPLPAHRFSGWALYDWGYQGAGFVWFPLKQSLLDRDFDRWGVANEQAFREIQYALYARDAEMFLTVLDKYNVQYLTWDTSVISFEEKNRTQILFSREIQELLEELIQEEKLMHLKSFGSMHVYRLAEQRHEILVQQMNTRVDPPYRWTYRDFAYEHHGAYITGGSAPYMVYYPFRDMVTTTDRVRPDILSIDERNNVYSILPTVPEQYRQVEFPNYIDTERALIVYISIRQVSDTQYLLLFESLLPDGLVSPLVYPLILSEENQGNQIEVNGRSYLLNVSSLQDGEERLLGQGFVHIDLPNYVNGRPVVLQYQDTSQPTGEIRGGEIPLPRIAFDAQEIAQIQELRQNDPQISLREDGESLALSVRNGQRGVHLPLDEIPQNIGYILTFRSRNIAGLPLRFCIQNLYTQNCTQYDELSDSEDWVSDSFLIPAGTTASGYGLSVDSISFGDFASVNELQEVLMFPIQQNFFSSLYYANGDPPTTPPSVSVVPVISESLSHKKVLQMPPFSQRDGTYIVFHQAYHSDWALYGYTSSSPPWYARLFPMLGGQKVADHVVVNNWANGWQVEAAHSSYILFFLPQYLQYMGVLLGLVGLIGTMPLGWVRNQ